MIRVLIDACVLYPSVLRTILMRCAAEGLFVPCWSARIIEEWRRAAEKNGIGAEAATEIALLNANWRAAEVTVASGAIDALFLPDENDRHVLAAAIAGQAQELLTANTSDFPTRILAQHGILRRHPDEFLLELAYEEPEKLRQIIDQVCDWAQKDTGSPVNRKKLLQKSGLPRLAKWDRTIPD